MVAGIMLLLGAIFAMIYFFQWLYIFAILGPEGLAFLAMFFGGLVAIIYFCFIMSLLGFIFGIIGAIMAFKRKKWGVCLLASIFLLLCGGLFFLGSVFGLLALIFVIIAKKEFQ